MGLIKQKLESLHACPEAIKWAGDREDLEAMWHDCERGDWLNWLIVKLLPEQQWRPVVRRIALDVIDLWDAPDIVRRYLETGDEAIRQAALDAAADAYAAAADADAYAAAAAAAAAYDAASYDAAADAAANAYYADKYAALEKYAGIIREMIPFADVQAALEKI